MRCIAVALVLLGACAAPQADQHAPVLRVGGSSSVMSKLTPMLTETHAQAVGSMAFELLPDDSSDGIGSLLAGEADLAVAERAEIPAEEEQARANGYSLRAEGARHIVAVDVLAISVHPSNPVESLTYDQVIGIWCSAAVDNWTFLGMDDRPIRVLTTEPLSGERALFEDFFCGPRGIHPKVEVANLATIQEALRTDPNTIAYVSMTEVSGKVLGLRPDVAGQAVLPSQQNIIRGAYPLYQDVYVYTAGPATGPEADFIAWAQSPAGQEVVDEARFVPLFLRPERLDEPRPLRETIHFEPGSSVPNQRSAARLQLLVGELKERAGEYRHVVLEGYTDNKEPEADELSRARAQAVASELEQELPGLFFEIIPRGATNPIAPNETPYGRMRNRRVQIYLAEEEAGGSDIVVQGSEDDQNG